MRFHLAKTAFSLCAALLLGACAQAKTTADGTPIEECFLGYCEPLSLAEQENYRRYNVSFRRDRSLCRNQSQIAYESSTGYIVAKTLLETQRLGCKSDDFKCRSKFDTELRKLRYDPDLDPRFRQCVLEKGWVDYQGNGWKRGRVGDAPQAAAGTY